MKSPSGLHRVLARANFPVAVLVALLQRAPVLRVAAIAGDTVLASPAGAVLRSAVAAAASLGLIHTLAGASGSVVASPSGSLSAVSGTPAAAAFTVGNAQNISSWVVGAGSTIPPGMVFWGGGSSLQLTGPGIVNVPNQIAELTGTPTKPGTYEISLTAWNGPNGTGTYSSPGPFNYVIYVTGTAVNPPVITQAASPASATVATGRTVVFNALATGTPSPSYQWTLNGSATIPGATTTTDPILMVTGTTLANAGTYTCTATNAGGSVSTSAVLTEVASSTPGYLTNLSARANVGTGANILIGGFSISGTGSKTVLIRGEGPALALPPFNLTGTLPNPQLQLYSGSGLLHSNDNWGTPAYSGAASAATLASAFSTLGAFALTSGSLDSALLVTLPVAASAGFTALVSDVGGNTGVGLVELYDADSNAPGVRLVNVSARNLVGTGANILIGGFAIGGTTAETVLIRADGPTLALAPFNLSGTLAQPVLQVYDHLGTLIYSNTVWGGDPILSSAMATVGAFPLSPSSQDSAVLVTLPQGAYTTLVSGVNSSVGIALVEIYEVY
jgi:hypothetical protein